MSHLSNNNNRAFRKGHRRTLASADILTICNVPRIQPPPSLYTPATSDSEDGGESYPTTPLSDISFNLTIVSRPEALVIKPMLLALPGEKLRSREFGSVLVHSVPVNKKRFRKIVEETSQL